MSWYEIGVVQYSNYAIKASSKEEAIRALENEIEFDEAQINGVYDEDKDVGAVHTLIRCTEHRNIIFANA